MNHTHDCPLCTRPGVPHHHATCAPCWRAVPRGIRRRLTAAWVHRTVNPREHHEALAELLQWARDAGLRP